MVYGNEITDSEGNVVFRCEFDDRFEFKEKDMFYLMHKVGLFGMLGSIKKFWVDKKYQKGVIKRDKETDKLYRKYKRFID
jgi:hypothetical protein